MKRLLSVAIAAALLVGTGLSGARLTGAPTPAAAQDKPGGHKELKDALDSLDKQIETTMTDFTEGRIATSDAAFERTNVLIKFKKETVIPLLPVVLGTQFQTWHKLLNDLDVALESARTYAAGTLPFRDNADTRRELIGRLQHAKFIKDHDLRPLVPKGEKGVLFGIQTLDEQIDQTIKDVQDGKAGADIVASIAKLEATKHEGIVNELPKVFGAAFAAWHDGLNQLDTALESAHTLATMTAEPVVDGKKISDLLGVAKTVKETRLLALLGPCNENEKK